MGYTHYWSSTQEVKFTNEQKFLINQVLKEHEDILDPANAPIYATEDYEIFLNGRGEDSHETFAVSPGPIEFEFCKTARKPYDVVVCKLLLILSLSKGFSFSSDGIWTDDKTGEVRWDDEWNEPRDWFRMVGFDPDIPFKLVKKEDEVA